MDRPQVPLDRDGRMTLSGATAAIEGSPALATDSAPANRSRTGRRLPLGDAFPAAGVRGREPHPVMETACRTAAWLRGSQFEDGHWRGPLEGDTILESEYLL